jgi:hypothetical protein
MQGEMFLYKPGVACVASSRKISPAPENFASAKAWPSLATRARDTLAPSDAAVCRKIGRRAQARKQAPLAKKLG